MTNDIWKMNLDQAQPAGLARVARFLDPVIFYTLLAVIALTAIPYGTVEPWWVGTFECAIFALGLLWAIEGLLSGAWLVRQHRLLIPLLVLVIFAFIQMTLPLRSFSVAGSTKSAWRPISFSPFDTQLFIYELLALIVVAALLLRYTTNRQRFKALLSVVIGVGLASTVFGLVRRAVQHKPGFLLPHLLQPDDAGLRGIGFGQFINHNHFAFLAEMSLGLILGLMVCGRLRLKNLALGLAMAIPLWVAIVYSGSRGGLASMMGQVLFLALLVLLVRPGRELLQAGVYSRASRLGWETGVPGGAAALSAQAVIPSGAERGLQPSSGYPSGAGRGPQPSISAGVGGKDACAPRRPHSGTASEWETEVPAPGDPSGAAPPGWTGAARVEWKEEATRGDRARQIGQVLLIRVALIAALLIAMFVGIVWVGGDPLAERLESVPNEFGTKESDKYTRTYRSKIWPMTWQLIKDYPVAGVGFGGYWIAITKYHYGSGEATPQQAHNDYLELLASGGLIGAALGVWFVFAFIKELSVRLRHPTTTPGGLPFCHPSAHGAPAEMLGRGPRSAALGTPGWGPRSDWLLRASCFGALAGIFAVALHSFVDFGLHVTINGVLFMALLVIAAVSSKQ